MNIVEQTGRTYDKYLPSGKYWVLPWGFWEHCSSLLSILKCGYIHHPFYFFTFCAHVFFIKVNAKNKSINLLAADVGQLIKAFKLGSISPNHTLCDGHFISPVFPRLESSHLRRRKKKKSLASGYNLVLLHVEIRVLDKDTWTLLYECLLSPFSWSEGC